MVIIGSRTSCDPVQRISNFFYSVTYNFDAYIFNNFPP